jgi:hypothetical protein
MWNQDTAPEEDAGLGGTTTLWARCSPVRQPDQAQATQPLANGQDDLSLSMGMLDSVKIVEMMREQLRQDWAGIEALAARLVADQRLRRDPGRPNRDQERAPLIAWVTLAPRNDPPTSISACATTVDSTSRRSSP